MCRLLEAVSRLRVDTEGDWERSMPPSPWRRSGETSIRPLPRLGRLPVLDAEARLIARPARTRPKAAPAELSPARRPPRRVGGRRGRLTRRSGGLSYTRAEATTPAGVVHPADAGRGVRLLYGGRAGGLQAALRPGSPGSLPGRGEQATHRRHPHSDPGESRPAGAGRSGVLPQRDGEPVHGERDAGGLPLRRGDRAAHGGGLRAAALW